MKFYESKPQLFINNRSRFKKAMDKNAIAVFQANEEVISNGDAIYRYKPHSDLFWLTGITQENTMLILAPSHPIKEYREILVLQRPSTLKEKWDGKRLSKKDSKSFSGISTIVWKENIDALITKLVHDTNIIYLNTNENDRKPNYINTSDYNLIQAWKQKFPLHHYKRSAPLLKSLRGTKTKHEIKLVQKAIDITHNTFLHILQLVHPQVTENALEGEIIKMFLAQKANDAAYSSIVASGANACILHYIENNQVCKDGELILFDFGANYSGYCADLSRTIPVNGKFTKRQKEVYSACLNLHNYAKSILKPGITLANYTEQVGKQATKEFIKIGLLSKADVKNEDKLNPAYRRYLYHGISHHLGVDVHDLGDTLHPIKEGMLFTVEPGIYITEEAMGIRIENNIWVKKGKNIDLMKHIPITIEDIEQYMRKRKNKHMDI